MEKMPENPQREVSLENTYGQMRKFVLNYGESLPENVYEDKYREILKRQQDDDLYANIRKPKEVLKRQQDDDLFGTVEDTKNILTPRERQRAGGTWKEKVVQGFKQILRIKKS